jgi:hypothetical protein
MDQMGKTIASDTGLAFRPADGQRIGGRYQRNVQLASGRYAMLVAERGFSLVPWKRVIEKHRGKTIAATVRGSDVSWEIRLQRSLSLS